jgi:hypothetical protein
VVPVDSRASDEELAAQNAELRAMVEALRAQVAELRRRLEQNRWNSSRPPPSDSPCVKPELKSLRRRGGRKPGGRQGHPGSTLAQVANTAPPDSAWCWADQAADALVAMHRLVAEAIAAGTDTDTLNTHIQLYRSAAQIGITQTAAAKHSHHFLDTLARLAEGRAWLPATQ